MQRRDVYEAIENCRTVLEKAIEEELKKEEGVIIFTKECEHATIDAYGVSVIEEFKALRLTKEGDIFVDYREGYTDYVEHISSFTIDELVEIIDGI